MRSEIETIDIPINMQTKLLIIGMNLTAPLIIEAITAVSTINHACCTVFDQPNIKTSCNEK
jgi:hypothetical protein